MSILPALLIAAMASQSGNFSLGLGLGVGFFLFVFVVTFLILAGFGWLVNQVPGSWGLIISVGIFLIGLVLFQPELDFIGLAGLLFLYAPRNRRLARSLKL